MRSAAWSSGNVLVLAALTWNPAAARCQSVFDSELRLAPQYVQYRIAAPAGETISQLAIPLFVTVPVMPRFTVDVGTSYARSHLSSDRGASAIDGLTDTQVRGNLTFGSDFLVLTAGLNLPTGTRSVRLDQFGAASRIASDFLAFPIANMGTGFSGTGGVAIARPVGDWNLGFGASLRRATAYEPFNIPAQSIRYQPGNEYRARLGADRTMGDGRVALGLTYSAFGEDDAGGNRFRSGSRAIAQSVYSATVGGNELVLGAYNVFRASGQYASGEPAGRENMLDLFASLGTHSRGALIEPTVELRHWLQNVPGATGGTTAPARAQRSFLASFGVRTRVERWGITAFPGIGYTSGILATSDATGAPAHAGLTGFRAQLAMRASPLLVP